MIHFYYSQTGEYNISQLPDVGESILIDEHNNKLIVFGNKEFYFSKLSDNVSIDASNSSIGLSQKGGYYLLRNITNVDASVSALQTKEAADIRALNSSITALNTSINRVNSSVNTSISALVTKTNNTNTSVSALYTRVNSSYVALTNLINADISILNASINRVNTSVNNYFNAVNTSVNRWITVLDSSLSQAIEDHRITEEEWAGIFMFMDSSLTVSNTSIADLERRVAALEAAQST